MRINKFYFKIRTFLVVTTLALFLTSCSNTESNNINSSEKSNSLHPKSELLFQKIKNKINNKDSFIFVDELNLNEFNNSDLLNAYNDIKNLENTHFLYSKLSFELKDYIIRKYFSKNENIKDKNIFNELPFIIDYKESSTAFYELDYDKSYSANNFLEKSYISSPIKFSKVENSIAVLHVSLEAPNARVGGIAEYLTGLTKAEINFNQTTSIDKISPKLITPFYDFLKIRYLNQVKFIGFIDSFIDNQIVKSSVYFINENGIKQYFIQPDTNYSFNNGFEIKKGWEIFDVKQQTQLYATVGNQVGWLYFSSAVASFASLFHGQMKNENIDVIHINGRNLAFINPLLAEKMNSKRVFFGLDRVGILSTIHDTSESEIEVSNQNFERLGMTKGSNPLVHLNIVMNSNTHMTNFVSKSMVNNVIKKDFWQNPEVAFLLEKLHIDGRFIGINNGIFFNNFDITKSSTLGSLAVKSDYSNYAEKKQESKSILFHKGIIGSETKPLYLFVGRYSYEKGIDVLAEFAKDIVLNKNGQVVIMGSLTGGSISPFLLEMVSLAKNPIYQGLIKFYANYETDQLAILNNIGASKGKLIRFASDFTLVPSIIEAAGLVPAEGLSMGSATISSYLQGLQDQCKKPFNYINSLGTINTVNNFTCIPFERDFASTQITNINLSNSLGTFLSDWNLLTTQEKINLQLSLIEDAKTFDWNAKNGSLEQYLETYKKVIKLAHSF